MAIDYWQGAGKLHFLPENTIVFRIVVWRIRLTSAYAACMVVLFDYCNVYHLEAETSLKMEINWLITTILFMLARRSNWFGPNNVSLILYGLMPYNSGIKSS
jgi:hypothetical protein